MGGERDCDLVVDVRPFGMVIATFCDERDLRHKGEGLHEICEGEFADHGIPLRLMAPVRESGQQLALDPLFELFRHPAPSLSWNAARADSRPARARQ